MNKIIKRVLGILTALSLGAVLMFPVPASAAEGTDGTELQVMQPEQLEIQLGTEWAGVEFQLKTDSGMYPGNIPVGADGVLRLEIGGSSSYILTCLNSAVTVPDPTQALATTENAQDETQEHTEADGKMESEVAEHENEEMETSPAPVQAEQTVAGIPVLHLVLFGGGMMLAVGSLIVMYVMKRRSVVDADYEDDDED